MSQFIRIRISQGSSSGPYTIYYNQVTPGNVAQIYGPTTPYLPATNVTFSQLTGISGYLIIVVPDTAYQIILVDNVNPCPPIIQPIPVPTPTATVTPTPTPTNPPGGSFTLQWSILPSVLANVYFDKDPVVLPQDSYYWGISVYNNNLFQYRPLETVTNNGIVSSRDVIVPNIYEFPARILISTSFLTGINQPNPIYFNIKLYLNGIFTGTQSQTYGFNPSNTTPRGSGLIQVGTSILVQDGDVIKIELS